MDGGSTDESAAVLKNAPRHVRWRSEGDRGQSHALNKALAVSRGEIIGWLNSDDAYFSGEAVAAAVELFEQRPDIDVVYGNAALVNANGLILQMIWTPPFSYRLLGLHNFIIQPAAFIRRSALGDTIADEAYAFAMDRELWLRLGREHAFASLDQVLAIDRQHPARKTSSRPDLVRADRARIEAAYPVPRGAWATATRKALKIAFRLLGIRLLRQASGPLAFAGQSDGFRRLAVRQLAVPRAAMAAAGGEPSAERLPS